MWKPVLSRVIMISLKSKVRYFSAVLMPYWKTQKILVMMNPSQKLHIAQSGRKVNVRTHMGSFNNISNSITKNGVGSNNRE